MLDANLQQLVGTTETGFPTSALVVGRRRDGLVLPHVLHCHTQEQEQGQESIATTTAFPAVYVYISEYLGMRNSNHVCCLSVCLFRFTLFVSVYFCGMIGRIWKYTVQRHPITGALLLAEVPYPELMLDKSNFASSIYFRARYAAQLQQTSAEADSVTGGAGATTSSAGAALFSDLVR
jgi:hypothetical protein